jgi:hypothetical protein
VHYSREYYSGGHFAPFTREKFFISIRTYCLKSGFMAKCPKCKKEVSTPKKTWKMAGKKDKSGKRTELTIGLYECCGKSFRSVLNKRKI